MKKCICPTGVCIEERHGPRTGIVCADQPEEVIMNHYRSPAPGYAEGGAMLIVLAVTAAIVTVVLVLAW